MAALFSVTDRVNGLTFNVALWEIRAAATNKPKVMEIQATNEAAVTTNLGIGRPAVAGSFPAVERRAVDEDTGTSESITVFRRAWRTYPTTPANFLFRGTIVGTVGAGLLWVFPRGIGIPAGGSLVLWNTSLTTAPDLTVWAVIAE